MTSTGSTGHRGAAPICDPLGHRGNTKDPNTFNEFRLSGLAQWDATAYPGRAAVNHSLRNFEGMATTRERSMEWPRQSRIAVGSAASHGVSIVSSRLFP